MLFASDSQMSRHTPHPTHLASSVTALLVAGSMLMVLSLLGVLGTLVSDLLLLWLDPRIRFYR